jgi:hypothetical protein
MSDVLSHLDHALEATEMAHSTMRNDDLLATMRWIRAANESLADAGGDLVQRAYDEGATKKAIAQALDVPVSVLRDLRKTKSRIGDGLDPLRAMLP